MLAAIKDLHPATQVVVVVCATVVVCWVAYWLSRMWRDV